tara:strand:- start:1014 stop:1427 length:414 start_codon:yes stop_codon:yes gene_type:complete
MKDQLISFETAKLAKDKEFDIPVFWYHSTVDGKRMEEDIEKGYSGSQIPAHNFNSGAEEIVEVELFSAPTQSLLQRWLREKHNILIQVTCLYFTPFTWYCKILNKPSMGVETSIRKGTTYEAALEEGLQEALKLLES